MTDGHFNEEYRIIRADGTVRWISARSFPVFHGETLIRTVGIAHDVTTQKLLESELEDEGTRSSPLGAAATRQTRKPALKLHKNTGPHAHICVSNAFELHRPSKQG